MKYLIPLIVTALVGATGYATWLFAPDAVEDCCEYVGILAPDGVSEVPGQDHVDFVGPTSDGRIPDSVPGLRTNDVAPEISLPDIDGQQRTVNYADSEFTVIVWVSSFCPTSKIYEARLNELSDDFSDVAFWGINSSQMETVSELARHYGDGDADRLRMPVLKDDRNVLADVFGAQVSAEVFVLDREGRLQYRGGIDDARNPQRVEVEYLRTVLEQLLDGDEPEWRYQPAKGCCPIDKLGADEKTDAPDPKAVSQAE